MSAELNILADRVRELNRLRYLAQAADNAVMKKWIEIYERVPAALCEVSNSYAVAPEPVNTPKPKTPKPGTRYAKLLSHFNGEPLLRTEIESAVGEEMAPQEVKTVLRYLQRENYVTIVGQSRPHRFKKVALMACILPLLASCSLVREPAWMNTNPDAQIQKHEQGKPKAVAKSRSSKPTIAPVAVSGLKPPIPPGMTQKQGRVARAPLRAVPAPVAPPSVTNWFSDLKWDASPSAGVQTYEVLYGPAVGRLTNSLVTSETSVRVEGLDPHVWRYYFGVRASNGQTNSVLSNLVQNPPDIIYSLWVQRGPKLTGILTNWIIVNKFTNSPPEPEQAFRLMFSEEKDYAP